VARGVAIREFPLKEWHRKADYLLHEGYLDFVYAKMV
jgi:hypothetical protein